jgi:hypothetical protein
VPAAISLDEAIDLTRTGDVWIFRGHSAPDRAIQLTTNSPVNHVGMSLVIEDMPPLMWHAELGRSLPDLWSGTFHRGVQLHDLRSAVTVWARRYGQRGWLRQLEPTATAAMEDAALRMVARLDGTPFPSTAQLAWRWARGRLPQLPGRARWSAQPGLAGSPLLADQAPGPRSDSGRDSGSDSSRDTGLAGGDGGAAGRDGGAAGRDGWAAGRDGWAAGRDGWAAGRDGWAGAQPSAVDDAAPALETAYCAEVVALTYEAMDLLPRGRQPSWYDPGRFWSGDELKLRDDYRLGDEIAVELPD